MDRSARLVLRDRLLRELLQPSTASAPSGSLLSATDEEAVLALDGGRSWLLTVTAAEELGQRAAAILDAHPGDRIVLVAVGGDADTARALKRLVPLLQVRTRIAAYQFDDAGRLRRLVGRASPSLGLAGKRIRDRLATLQDERASTKEELAGWIEAARVEAEGEKQFTASLQATFPIVTLSIAVVCIALFALSSYWGRDRFDAALWRLGAGQHERLLAGEWWRLLAACFLHGNLVHLVVNMMALASFGVFLERLLGPYRYFVLYTVSGLAGSLASAFVPRPGIAIGASGAIWGLMAAGVGLAWKPRGYLPPLTLSQFKQRAMAPLVINVFYSFKAGIDFMAHFGGGAAGFALMASGAILRGLRPAFPSEEHASPVIPRSTAWRAAATLCALASIGSVGTAMAVHRPWELLRPQPERVSIGDTGLSLELPARMEGRLPRTSETWEVFTYGNLDTDVTLVEVKVFRPDSSVRMDDETQQSLLAGLRSTSDGSELVGSPRLEEVGGRKLAVVDRRFPNGIVFRSFVGVVEGRMVLLRLYAYGDLDDWDAMTHRVAASLARAS